ncbi:hypothetical protein [Xylanibacter ruminicola]|uniref:Uncharacterized protein n=1 Tax=Xylanibacter ruminicola TaxID=839 RepID=A0A1M6Z408_XYLRU|nr:hypothetical protein [Xylanibacter ruminicola]SHL25244.1 hypothetical protein SAMN05216463_1399 [Xylanibacter ruminicola]
MIFLTVLVNLFTSKKEYVDKAVSSLTDPEEIEKKKRLATRFWNALDSNDIWMFLIMLFITTLVCWYYYIPYNRKAGRHYHPLHCALFGLGAVLLSGIATYLFCLGIVKVSYDTSLVMKVCFMNAIYSLLWVFVCSFIFCNYSSTNAYRWFKIR